MVYIIDLLAITILVCHVHIHYAHIFTGFLSTAEQESTRQHQLEGMLVNNFVAFRKHNVAMVAKRLRIKHYNSGYCVMFNFSCVVYCSC